jgi:hypothetical protein
VCSKLGRKPHATTEGILFGAIAHSGFETEGLRGVGAVDGRTGMRPQSHEGVHCGVPEDVAAGGLHDEGVGVEVLIFRVHHDIQELARLSKRSVLNCPNIGCRNRGDGFL